MKHVLIAGVVLVAGVVALTGCSASPATLEARASPAPTVTVTGTASAAPIAEAPGDKLTPLTVWTACAAVAQVEYTDKHPGSGIRPYRGGTDVTDNGDGSFTAIVGITAPADAKLNGGIITSCTLSGSRGNPVMEHWTMKDI